MSKEVKEKQCSKCKKILPVEKFRKDAGKRTGYRSQCKDCEKARIHKYYEDNKEDLLIKNKAYCQNNKEKIYKQKRKNIESKYEYYQQMWHNYYIANKEKHAENSKRWAAKQRESDPLFRLKSNIRSMIGHSFHRTGWFKKELSEEIIGMDVDDFVLYLLQTYKYFYGYEWDKKEKVHIDHIIPISTAKTEEDIIKLCHYTNLRLLKAFDNMTKHDKLVWEGDINHDQT